MSDNSKSLPADITHVVSCKDCRDFHREMIQEDREQTKEDFRNIVKEEWQCSLNTIERVTKIEKKIFWLIGLVSGAWAAIIFIFIIIIKLYHK